MFFSFLQAMRDQNGCHAVCIIVTTLMKEVVSVEFELYIPLFVLLLQYPVGFCRGKTFGCIR